MEYTLTVYQIGRPAWFSAVKCRLVLFEGHKRLCAENISVYNDGGDANSDNFSVYWHEDSVEVIVSGEGGDLTYILYYDGRSS